MADALYVQIADDLRHKIGSGELPPGSQLPPEPRLQEEYTKLPGFSGSEKDQKVSRNTVRDAIDLLVREKRVEKRPGQGTFVVEKVDPFVTTLSGDPEGGESAGYRSEVRKRLGREPDLSIPRVEIHKSSRAPELRLPEGEHVVSRHQERLINGTPYSMQTSFYPLSYATKAPRLITAADIDEGAVAYIQHELDVKQAGWRDEVRVRTANGIENEFFKLSLKSGAQVIEIFRTAFDTDGKPMRLTVTVYAADRNRITYEGGTVPEPPSVTPPGPGGSTR
jgi:GntR family transcriptional regulator